MIDANPCQWDVGFEILNIGACGPTVSDMVRTAVVLDQVGTYQLDTTTEELRRPDLSIEPLPFVIVFQATDEKRLFVIVATSFQIGAQTRLEILGEHAPVVVASGDIIIDGQLDVSAQGTINGAGALGSCDEGNGQTGNQSRTGGGGGGFATSGGQGGIAGFGDAPAGGVAALDSDLEPLRGGCRGGNGQGGLISPGGGGGAIELVSATSIQVNGLIAAAGGGGAGGGSTFLSGGGGGGSGGAILLQAPVVDRADGVLLVHGGGGGGGGALTNGLPGTTLGGAGGDPLPQDIGPGGAGGDGAPGSFPGGSGQSTLAPQGEQPAGGGGGGGGYGRIRIVTD